MTAKPSDLSLRGRGMAQPLMPIRHEEEVTLGIGYLETLYCVKFSATLKLF